MKRASRNVSEQGMRGVLAASLTPRRASEPVVDLAALLEVIDFLCSAGVQGIVLFGSTGEFVHFGSADRSRALSLAVKRSRCPVYANVAHSNLDSALALADEAASTGAAGVLLTPPIYFRYDQETVRQYYLEFLNAVHGMLPAYLYNIPAFCTPISVETAASLIADGYAGIKDSSGDWDNFQALSRYKQEHPFTLLVGHDAIFARARGAGADGVVSGVACAIPELLLALDRAIARHDEAETERLDARLHEFLDRMECFPTPVAIKAALAARGIKTGPSPVPLAPETQAALDEFRDWFRAWL